MADRRRLILTAGHSRALHVVALGELLVRRGHDVQAVIVVSDASVGRLRAVVRQQGLGAVRKLIERFRERPSAEDPLVQYMGEQRVERESVLRWAERRRVKVQRVQNLNSPQAIQFIRGLAPDLVVYGGGGIMRAPVLEASGKVINAHAGPLPEIRGMNAIEWAVLLGAPRAVSIHFIDCGIDTGASLLRVPVPLPERPSVDALRRLAVVCGVQGLLHVIDNDLWSGVDVHGPPPVDRQCFVMAPVVRELVEEYLRREPQTTGPVRQDPRSHT